MPDKKTELEITQIVMLPFKKLDITKNIVKIHSKEQIKGLAEMMKLGKFNQPFVVSHNKKGNYDVIAGKGRYLAIKNYFITPEEVPCVLLEDLSEDQLKAYMLLDNKIAESEWNIENTQSILSQIPDFDFPSFNVDFNSFTEQNSMLLSEQEWQNMPEFVQGKKDCHQLIMIRFDKAKDVKKFGETIGQNITDKTKSIWFPEKAKSDTIQTWTPKKK